VGWGDIQSRHDPFFYLPRFVHLEQRILARTNLKLRDFIQAMSGGATPKAEEQEKYYADSETGIPFVRVQNLSVSGELDLSDVKYINRETHDGMLARSHVSDSDLLVKITGVGRMAISSVPPPDFEGNINQHIVCIETGSRHVSEVLAAYLNTDVAETLAKRRSTGGTRPALDYGALRSIPVIYDERILPALKDAYTCHKQALRLASHKFSEIDDYLLAELGLTLPPEPENTIANRMFTARRRELEHRLDPAYFSTRFSRIQHGIKQHTHTRLRDIAEFSSEQWDQKSGFGDAFPYLEISAIDTQTGEIVSLEKTPIDEAPSRARMLARHGDLLISTTRPNRGAITMVDPEKPDAFVASTGFSIIRSIDESRISKPFLLILLRSQLCLMQMEQRSSGGNYPAISQTELGRLLIPDVSIRLQEKIVSHVESLKKQAKLLRQQAEAELEQAKRRIESLLLGETVEAPRSAPRQARGQ
jgi:hypothetical protein